MTSRNQGATPMRATRSHSKMRDTLPAIQPKQSYSYGAQGKATLRSQVRTTATNFAGEFNANRALDEDDEEEAAPAAAAAPERSPAQRVRRRQPTAGQSSAPAVAEEVSERQGTFLDLGAQYGGGIAALATEMRQLARIVFFGFSGLAFLLLSALFLHYVLTTGRIQTAVSTTAVGMPSGVLPEYNQPNLQWTVMAGVVRRLDEIDSRVASLEATATLPSSGETLGEKLKRKMNWFSVGAGAVVDPYLTSPTQKHPTKSILQSIYLKISPLVVGPNPPIASLLGWDDSMDCWCAMNDPEGVARLGIHMVTKIHPETLYVEHIPSTATLNIAAAPKALEVWAEMGSEAEFEHFSDLFHGKMMFQHGHGCKAPPGKNWVCIAIGEYDIHSYQYVQAIPMEMSTKEVGLAASKLVVTVTENWGANWTCIYRLRMMGDRSDIKETMQAKFD